MFDDPRLDLRSMNIPNGLMHLFKSRMKSLYSQFWFCILKAVNQIMLEKWVTWIPSVMFSMYCWRLVVIVGPLPYSWWKESPSWLGWWEPVYSRECGGMVWGDDGVTISSRRNWRCRGTSSSLWETGKRGMRLRNSAGWEWINTTLWVMCCDIRSMWFLKFPCFMCMPIIRMILDGLWDRCKSDFYKAHENQLFHLVDATTVRSIHRCQRETWELKWRVDCGKYEKDTEEFKKCSRCKKTFYCSRECQIADWKIHKHGCGKKE